MSSPAQAPAGRDSMANLGLGLLGVIALVGVVLRAAASLAALLTGQPQPTGGPFTGIMAFFNPADPGSGMGAEGLKAWAYWSCAVGMLALVGWLAAWARIAFRRSERRAKADPHHIAGTATRDEIKRLASAKALLRRGSTLRPSIDTPQPADVGYWGVMLGVDMD